MLLSDGLLPFFFSFHSLNDSLSVGISVSIEPYSFIGNAPGQRSYGLYHLLNLDLASDSNSN